VDQGSDRKDSLDKLSYGLQYGVVTQNKDPDNLNRIKVKFPWLDSGDTDESHWAQLVVPMEGPKFGWYALPDLDDVVAVMFIDGDFAQPVILGGIWSTKDNSPETNEDGKNNFRGYRSRSGHRLILDDSAKTKVVLSDKTGKMMIGVGNFEKEGAGPNVTEVFTPPMAGKTGISISTMDSGGQFCITCKDGKLSLTAEQAIKISTTQTMDVKATGAVKLSGTSTTKVTSGQPSNYDAPSIKIG
jgi:uncharacterized protein involved in type VI secretion and phage assembly